MSLFCSDEHCSFLYPFSHFKKLTFPHSFLHSFILSIFPNNTHIYSSDSLRRWVHATVIIIFTHPFLIHKHSYFLPLKQPILLSKFPNIIIYFSTFFIFTFDVPLPCIRRQYPFDSNVHSIPSKQHISHLSKVLKHKQRQFEMSKPCMNTYVCNTKPVFQIWRLDRPFHSLRNDWFRSWIVLAFVWWFCLSVPCSKPVDSVN